MEKKRTATNDIKSMNLWNRMVRALVFFGALVFAATTMANTAGAAPYTDNGNGTVADGGSELIWQQADSYHELKKGMNWYEALEYVASKNLEKFAGFDDWRLPTRDELKSLYDPSRQVKSKDGERLGLPPVFKGGGSYYLWTHNERGLDNAWYFGLGFKEDYFNLKELGDLDQGVKMVRGKPIIE